MTSRKQKFKHIVTIPTSVACITVLACIFSCLYVRSFLVVDAKLFAPSSLPLETLPLFLALNRQDSKLDDVSPVPKFNSKLDDVNPAPKLNFGCIPELDECPVSLSRGLAEQQVRGSTLNGTGIELWNGDDNSSSPSEAVYDRELEGLDLRDILKYVSAEKRRQWIKRHWSKAKVLRSDEVSVQFSRRIKEFFDSGCTDRFFMTWISPLSGFKNRQLVALLSVFKHHPSACVVIISRSLDSDRGREVLGPLVDRGYKVVALAPDLPYLFNNTPAEKWLQNLQKGRVDPGEISFRQNLSNILRLLVLYKYGGIYLDNDVIVLRSLSNLSNSIGAQSQSPQTGEWYRLNNAVLVFDKEYPLLRSFIKEFALTFNGSKWGHNGPYLATRVLKRPGSDNCTVLPMQAFYPVSWIHISKFYDSPRGDRDEIWQHKKIRALLDNSYAVHLWNKETGGLRVQKGSIIDRLFRWIVQSPAADT